MSIKLSGAAVGRLKQWCSEHSVTRVYFTETAGAAGGMVRSTKGTPMAKTTNPLGDVMTRC